MAVNINQFVKDWYVGHVAGVSKLMRPGVKLSIGMTQETRPALNDDGLPSVGYVLYLADGTTLTSAQYNPLVLVDGVLRWNSDAQAQETPSILKRIYVAVAEATDGDGTRYSYLYATTVEGDPDQVVVWGANDGPPPGPGA